MNKYDKYVRPKLLEISDMCRMGYTDEQIFEALGISRTTFYKFIKEHPELDELITSSRQTMYVRVESELLRNAIGYDTTEVQKIYNPDGKIVSEKIITKHVAGDLASQKFLLTNRQRERWDRIENNNIIFESSQNKIDLSSKSTEDLLKIIEAAKKEDNNE